MRWSHVLIILVSGFLLLPDMTWSQSQGKGRAKGKQIAVDPYKFFDLLSGGKDVVVIAELDPQQLKMVQFLVVRYGVKLGDRVTREEYLQHVSAAMSLVKNGNSASPVPDPKIAAANSSSKPDSVPAPPKTGPGQAASAIDGADKYHRDEEKNAGIRPTNHPGPDGFKPRIYRVSKLPPGLPEWFARLDMQGDCDGQVGLWEARRDPNVLHHFASMDLNGDGLLTPDEVLRWQAMQKRNLDDSPDPAVGRTDKPSAESALGDRMIVDGDIPARVAPSTLSAIDPQSW
jgi:hypothetical protein